MTSETTFSPSRLERSFRSLAAPITWFVLRPLRLPSLRTPAALGLRYERVRLESEGASLSAWHVPCAGSRAGIVLCHGHNNCRAQVLPLIRPLHEAGFHLVLFDFRSHGTSGGKLCTYGYQEQHDVAAAVKWLRSEAGVERIGLYGVSMGGASALLAASRDPDIEAVVTDCAFARLEDMVGQRFFFLPPALRGSLGDSVRACAERQVGPVIGQVNPEAAVAAWTPRPLLVIHGERDMLTPAAHARRLAAAAGSLGDLWIVPWAPHAGSRWVAGRAYTRRVGEFFQRHLGEAVGLRAG